MKSKICAYAMLLLALAQVILVLLSWLITAAMPDVFPRSMLSPEGIRQNHLPPSQCLATGFGRVRFVSISHPSAHHRSSCHLAERDGWDRGKQFQQKHSAIHLFSHYSDESEFRGCK